MAVIELLFKFELAFVLLDFLFRSYQQFYLFGWFNKRALEVLIFFIPLSKDNPTRFYNNALDFYVLLKSSTRNKAEVEKNLYEKDKSNYAKC